MNSKIYFLILCSLLCGCGVRGRPSVPPETAIQSYVESYTGPTDTNEDKDSTLTIPEKNK